MSEVRQVIARQEFFDMALAIQRRVQAWNTKLSEMIRSLKETGGDAAAKSDDALIVGTLRTFMDCVSDLSQLKNEREREALQSLYDLGMVTLLTSTMTHETSAMEGRISKPGPSQSGAGVDINVPVGQREDGLTDPYGFSVREREILDRLLRSQRVSAIAREFKLSPHTVRNHLKNIFRKVGVGSQTQLLQHFYHQSVIS